MASPKRSKIERQRDKEIIAELYIKGKRQSEIAEIIGVTQQQISFDLKSIQKDWLKNTAILLDEFKVKELAKLDQLEREAWEAWRRSIGKIETKTIIAKGLKQNEEGKISSNLIDQNTRVEEKIGDPRFLDIVIRCVEKRCKLLGLDMPTKLAGVDGGPLTINIIEQGQAATQEKT